MLESSDDDIVEPTGPQFKIFTGVLKAFEKDVDGQARKFLSCTASSSVDDLHGDRMTEDCVMDMAPQAKRKAMTIFLNHSYKVPEDVFGKTTDAKVVNRAANDDGSPIYDLDLEIMLDESNPRALATYTSIKDQGMKLGVSIGALIEDYAFKDESEGFWGGLEIKKLNLLEASIVGIPANQRSWVINAMTALGAPKGVIAKALGKVEQKPAVKDETTKACPTCGKGRDASGCSDGYHDASIEPAKSAHFKITLDGKDVTDQVTLETIEDEPEDEDEDESSPDGGETQDESTDDATNESVDLAADAVERLRAAGVEGLQLELVMTLLEDATAEVVRLRGQVTTLTAERDEARQDVLEAAEIVETIAHTPIGRKAQFAGPVDSFRSRFAGIYDEGTLRLLDGETTE